MSLKILGLNDFCTACGACISACTQNALQLIPNDEGFYYPTLNDCKCTNCKACEKVCHILNPMKVDGEKLTYTPYMVQANSDELLRKSSSGGFFAMLSNAILNDGGVVYGARYNYNKERLEHCSTDVCSIEELRKSKYIESYMGNTFCDVYKNLKTGRPVLFCGTLCQVKGLKSFLSMKKACFDKLILVRLICHGVPSNKFFTEYKHFEERRKKSKVYHIDFRPKNHGWWSSNLIMKFENGKILDEDHTINYYYYCFQHNLFLRKSCYHCKLLNEIEGDFTIGDFWGIHIYNPGNKDNRGLSLVLVQSQKAKDIFQLIRKIADVRELPMNSVEYIYGDMAWRKSSLPESERLMISVKDIGYMPALQKQIGNTIKINKVSNTIRNSLIWKILRKIKSVL